MKWIFESRKALKIEFNGKAYLFKKAENGKFSFETNFDQLAIAIIELQDKRIRLVQGNGYKKPIDDIDYTPAELSMRVF